MAKKKLTTQKGFEINALCASSLDKGRVKKAIVVLIILLFISIALIGIIQTYKFTQIKDVMFKKESGLTGHAITLTSVTINNAAPTIDSISTFSSYTNYTNNAPATAFSVCSDNNNGVKIYTNINYTDNNIFKDVSERGNLWFRIRSISANGSYDSFDTGYLLCEFEAGDATKGIFNVSYVIYSANFTESSKNFSISAKIYDGVDTVYSTAIQDKSILIQKITCEVQLEPSGGGKKAPVLITLATLQEEKVIPVPVPAPPIPKKVPEEIEKIIEKVQVPEEEKEIRKGVLYEIVDQMSKYISFEAIISLEEEIINAINGVEIEANKQLPEEVKVEIFTDALRQAQEVIESGLEEQVKREKIDLLIKQTKEKTEQLLGVSKESNLIGKAISHLAPPKYEEVTSKEITLKENEEIAIIVGGVKHSLKVDKINAGDVEITIHSSETKLGIKLGKKKQVDFNNDYKADISITLLTIKDAHATFLVESEEAFIIESKKGTYLLITNISLLSDVDLLSYGILIIISVIVVLQIMKYSGKRTKRRRKNRRK